MNIDFLEVAALELDDAFAYYEYQQQNLGYRFTYEVWNTIERIKYYPKAWHRKRDKGTGYFNEISQ